MGYEIAGGLGVKLASPEREVYVLVGDGSYLMLSGELVTAVAERQKLTIVLVDNRGFKSIGNLSRSLGMDGFGTLYRYRANGELGVDSDESTDYLPVDLAANAESLGAKVFRAPTVPDLRAALEAARAETGPVVIATEGDRYEGVPDYDSWWDVAVAEVSEVATVRAGRGQSPSRETTLAALRAHRGTTIFDLDWRPTLWDDPRTYPALAAEAADAADVVIGNEEEVEAAQVDPTTLVLKRGERGATVYEHGDETDVAGFPVDVVNGLGAGDAFAAALGQALLNGASVVEAVRRGTVAGALVASRLACAGATPRLGER